MAKIGMALALALLAGCEDGYDNEEESETPLAPRVVHVTIDNQGYQYVSVHLEDADGRDRVDVSVPLRTAVSVDVTMLDRLRICVVRDWDDTLLLNDSWGRSALDAMGGRLYLTVYP